MSRIILGSLDRRIEIKTKGSLNLLNHLGRYRLSSLIPSHSVFGLKKSSVLITIA